MRIQKSIKKAIDEMSNNDFEAAMLHVCNAIDGTVQKKYGRESSKSDFKAFIRGYYDYIGALTGLYCLDFTEIGWPVTVKKPEGPDGKPDLADMIYHIHRCCHGHGVAVPDGFEFSPDIASKSKTITFGIKNGAIGLSDRFIWALIDLVILDPINSGLADPELDSYYIVLGDKKYFINEWWGRLGDFPSPPPRISKVTLDFNQLT